MKLTITFYRFPSVATESKKLVETRRVNKDTQNLLPPNLIKGLYRDKRQSHRECHRTGLKSKLPLRIQALLGSIGTQDPRDSFLRDNSRGPIRAAKNRPLGSPSRPARWVQEYPKELDNRTMVRKTVEVRCCK